MGNKGETIKIKKIGTNWFRIYPYWQTRWIRIKKKEAISEIRRSFENLLNIEIYGHLSFDKEVEKMGNRIYHYEYWHEKPD